MRTVQYRGRSSRRGTAAVIALVAVTVLVGLCGAMLMIASRSNNEGGATIDRHQAGSAAQAGVAHALVQLNSGNTNAIGSADQPLAFGGGSYFVEITPDADTNTCLVASHASVRGENESIEALLSGGSEDIYDHALFAGNTSDDPLYAMKLGGNGVQADHVEGDVYSGGSVTIGGNATVNGTIRAQDDVTGAPGETNVTQPVPDIAAMDYPHKADIDVSSLFATAKYKSNALGGKAYEMPQASPAHIFRKDPSDRSSDTSATVKSDYFLEDPYQPVNVDSGSSGKDACPIVLSGTNGAPGVSGNHKVYYIDGNLWVHNKITYSFKIKHNEPNGVQVTFVARGNIYFSDNVFYQNTDTDGIAFIAMKDTQVKDSGNIYFGDPVYGTLEAMHAFMYAENNFYDKNLSATGSAQVTVFGNMTAGNQVSINRDYGKQHSKLTVNYDDRISIGDLVMPGLPRSNDDGGSGYVLQALRRIPGL